MLEVQHRMNEEIMRFPCHQTYSGKLTAHPDVADHTLEELGMMTSLWEYGAITFTNMIEQMRRRGQVPVIWAPAPSYFAGPRTSEHQHRCRHHHHPYRHQHHQHQRHRHHHYL